VSTHSTLKVAHCNNVACTSAGLSTLDSAVDVGFFPSATIGADGLGLISYRDATNGDVKVAHCSNVACTSADNVTTIDSAGDTGFDTSATIGVDGLGLIGYWTNAGPVKIARCNDRLCTSATVSSLAMIPSGTSTSVTVGPDGRGLIGYVSSFGLTVAHCTDALCASASSSALGGPANLGYLSLTVGTDGLALISYYDQTTGDLKVAHCSNTFCVPYLRRR
jgi:hypothetical protein